MTGKKIWDSAHRLYKAPLVIRLAQRKFSDAQICAMLDLSPDSVRSMLWRARKDGYRIPLGPERKNHQLALLAKLLPEDPRHDPRA